METLLYREEDGTVPLLAWLAELQAKPRLKCYAYIDLLESRGHELRRPVADYLRDGIYELRPSYRGQQYRILYFFTGRQAVVLSHGLVKQKLVPPAEIARAVERKAKFLGNPDRHAFRPRETE